MVRSSFEVADFFIDEPIFLRNMRIFKKKSAKYRRKSALQNLMCSTLLRLTLGVIALEGRIAVTDNKHSSKAVHNVKPRFLKNLLLFYTTLRPKSTDFQRIKRRQSLFRYIAV